MTILFFVFLGVMAAAMGTTIIALVRAKDGFEDELGFHSPDAAPALQTSNGPLSADPFATRTAGRPVLSEPVMAPAPELRSALLEGRYSP